MNETNIPRAKPMPAPLTPYAPSGARTRGIYCTLPRTGAAAETEQALAAELERKEAQLARATAALEAKFVASEQVQAKLTVLTSRKSKFAAIADRKALGPGSVFGTSNHPRDIEVRTGTAKGRLVHMLPPSRKPCG